MTLYNKRPYLISAWKFDETTGTRLDSSTVNNDLIDNNSVAYSIYGKNGNCASFSLSDSISYKLSCGYWYTSILKISDGSIWTWGFNNYGQLGQNNTTNYSSPVSVLGNHSFIQISNGCGSNFALKSNGSIWACGYNITGQLGDNTRNNRSSPISVVGGLSYIQIAGGYSHCIALQSDGTVYGWGGNQRGELGNIVSYVSSPVLVASGYGFTKISAGWYRSNGLKSDNSAWSWGNNSFGQLGDNSIINKSIPSSVVGGHSFIDIICSSYHTMAIKDNGSIWAWGSNGTGQLGQNNLTNYSSPVSVLGDHSFIQMAIGEGFSSGLKADGSVWTWGYNNYGQLGQNNTTNYSSPISVVGNYNFNNIGNSYYNIICSKRDGVIWTCGLNTYGQLGDNSTTNRSSPVSVVDINSNSKYLTQSELNGYNSLSSFTISSWIKLNSIPYNTYSILSCLPNSGQGFGAFINSESKIQFSAETDSTPIVNTQGQSSLSIDVWYHLVFVYDGSYLYAYLNANLDNIPASITGNIIPFTELYVGNAPLLGSCFDGLIDEVYVWKTALSENEILELYNSDSGKFIQYTGTYDRFNKLMIHGNSNNDSSDNPHRLNLNNVTIDYTTYKFNNASLYFNGSTSYISVSNSDDWNFRDNDFTIDFQFYPRVQSRMAIYAFENDYRLGIDFHFQGTRNINIFASSNGTSWDMITAEPGGSGIGTISLNLNEWNHVALVRSGNNWKTFINGITDININVSGSIITRTEYMSIGRWGVGAIPFLNGNINEFRVSKGIARWTSNFTPPVNPYP